MQLLDRVPAVSVKDQQRIEQKAMRLIGSPEATRLWFGLKSPDLNGKTPLDVLRDGNLPLVEWIIDAGLEGDFG